MVKMYRQGDILLVEKQLPEGCMDAKTNVLALGEGSGNAHVMEGAKVVQKEDDIFVIITQEQEATLRHVNLQTKQQADHNEIKVQPGIYEVVHQREHDEITQEWRRIAD